MIVFTVIGIFCVIALVLFGATWLYVHLMSEISETRKDLQQKIKELTVMQIGEAMAEDAFVFQENREAFEALWQYGFMLKKRYLLRRNEVPLNIAMVKEKWQKGLKKPMPMPTPPPSEV